MVTPPVAIAAYAACGISGGNPFRTGIIAAVGFIVPFCFAFDQGGAERNAQAVRAFLQGLRKGLETMNRDRATAVATAARELNTKAALAERALDDTARLGILSQDLSVSESALRGTFDTLVSVGLLPPGTRFEAVRMVDTRYLGP